MSTEHPAIRKKLKTFRELLVWQKSIELSNTIYKNTKKFPEFEKFGLASQMQRAAVSIPSNIAEGWMRMSSKYFVHFLRIALGSLGELETQTEIAHREGYIKDVEYRDTISSIEEVRKMLYGTISSLNADR